MRPPLLVIMIHTYMHALQRNLQTVKQLLSCVSMCVADCLIICISVYASVCLSVFTSPLPSASACLSVLPLVRLSVSVSVCLSVCLSVSFWNDTKCVSWKLRASDLDSRTYFWDSLIWHSCTDKNLGLRFHERMHLKMLTTLSWADVLMSEGQISCIHHENPLAIMTVFLNVS